MKHTRQILTISAAVAFFFGIASINAPNAFSQVDANGDGICDITGQSIGSGAQAGKQAGTGNRQGPGDGTGYKGNGPQDGTGYGAQSGKRLGPQDGSQARIGQGNRATNHGQGMGNQSRRGGRR